MESARTGWRISLSRQKFFFHPTVAINIIICMMKIVMWYVHHQEGLRGMVMVSVLILLTKHSISDWFGKMIDKKTPAIKPAFSIKCECIIVQQF